MRLTPCAFTVVLAFCSFLPRTAQAWHNVGHMEVALIAYDQLHRADPALCAKLVEILRQHPRYALDFDVPAQLNDDEKGQWLFCLAASWPDYIRPVPGRDGPPRIPADPASKSSYHRETWHFINFPYGAPPDQAQALEARAKTHLNLDTSEPQQEAMGLNAIQALKLNTRILKTSNDARKQAVALCWILHLMGDLHHPLHCIALFTPSRFSPGPAEKAAGDRGGNSINWDVQDPRQARDANLHFLWDDAPGPNDEARQYGSVRKASDALMQAMNVQDLKAAAINLNPEDWANEDGAIARKEAYTNEILTKVLAFDENVVHGQTALGAWDPATYKTAIKPTAEKRVAEAGYRAAAWLRENAPN